MNVYRGDFVETKYDFLLKDDKFFKKYSEVWT